jgi:hypothetical protein
MPADAPVMSATGRAEVAMLNHPFSALFEERVTLRMNRREGDLNLARAGCKEKKPQG